MKKLFLHIGTHKTGTTSIQRSLSNLSTQKWRLIKLSRSANESNNLLKAFGDNCMNDQAISQARFIRDQYLSILRERITPCSLLSGEGMESFSANSFAAARDYFSGHDYDVYFVGYMRNLIDSVGSRFQQRLKASPKFAAKKVDWTDQLIRCMPSYPRMLQRLDSEVESTKIRLFAFDPISFPLQDVVVDFCLRLNIDADIAKFKASNESLSTIAIKILWISAVHGSSRLHSISAWKTLARKGCR